ncbi:MAG: hypothetical protein NC254_04880 [bacterium]|nr:hypothetical protein [bacterium]
MTKPEEKEQSAGEKGWLTADEVEAALESAVYLKKGKKDHLPARSTDSMNRDKWGQEMVFA